MRKSGIAAIIIAALVFGASIVAWYWEPEIENVPIPESVEVRKPVTYPKGCRDLPGFPKKVDQFKKTISKEECANQGGTECSLGGKTKQKEFWTQLLCYKGSKILGGITDPDIIGVE